MKNLFLIIPLIFLVSCSGKMIEGRFERTFFIPFKNLLNSETPQDLIEIDPFQNAPSPAKDFPSEKTVIPEEKEKPSTWWGN